MTVLTKKNERHAQHNQNARLNQDLYNNIFKRSDDDQQQFFYVLCEYFSSGFEIRPRNSCRRRLRKYNS